MSTKENTQSPKGSKGPKLSGHEQVVQFLNNLEHPFKKEIEVVRAIILSANPGISEHIKWNAPSFCYQDEDRITFNLQGKGFFRLVFHCGAKVRERIGEEPLLEDAAGLLEWVSPDRAIVKLTDMRDVEAKRESITVVVNRWIEAAKRK